MTRTTFIPKQTVIEADWLNYVDRKINEIVSVKDFGAVGDGVVDDTAAFNAAKVEIQNQKNAILNLTNGIYKTTASIWPNNVSPTYMAFSKPSVLGVFEGTDATPDIVTKDPVIYAQKYTKYDNGTDRFAHNVGGVFGEVVVKGTNVTGAVDTDGTWIGVLGNVVIKGENKGSTSVPDYDAYGSSIGIAGFARSTGYPGSGNIVCGVWGYAEGPTIDTTTQANLPTTNWSLCGVEANIQINHQNIGEQSVLVGKGSSVGFLAANYRTAGTGVMDWTFGMVLAGTPSDGNFSNTDVNLWNGFYTGLLIDKIKAKGIRFGQYFKSGSYGIWFPDSYVGTNEPAAAIYLGNNKINMGQYTGAIFANNDLWVNSDRLFYRSAGTNLQIVAFSGKGATADVPITGFLTVKDSTGANIKLAIIA